jgi:hypothetical protein
MKGGQVDDGDGGDKLRGSNLSSLYHAHHRNESTIIPDITRLSPLRTRSRASAMKDENGISARNAPQLYPPQQQQQGQVQSQQQQRNQSFSSMFDKVLALLKYARKQNLPLPQQDPRLARLQQGSGMNVMTFHPFIVGNCGSVQDRVQNKLVKQQQQQQTQAQQSERGVKRVGVNGGSRVAARFGRNPEPEDFTDFILVAKGNLGLKATTAVSGLSGKMVTDTMIGLGLPATSHLPMQSIGNSTNVRHQTPTAFDSRSLTQRRLQSTRGKSMNVGETSADKNF